MTDCRFIVAGAVFWREDVLEHHDPSPLMSGYGE
jgi:hypothetical protein